MLKYLSPMIFMIPILAACGVYALANNDINNSKDYPNTPDTCKIIGEPQNRTVTLADGLGEAVISMVPVELKSRKMGFSWMDGDGLVTRSESIQSVTDKRRAEREREKAAGPKG